MTILLGIFTFFLVLVSIIMVLAILAQRAKSDGGVGAALGGGMTEAAFGAESGNVLSKATTWMAVAFFVVSFGLYLGHLHLHRVELKESGEGLPNIPSLGAPASADPLALPESGLLNLPATPAPAPTEEAPAATPAP
jgi:preprotein translocase subunit SecG